MLISKIEDNNNIYIYSVYFIRSNIKEKEIKLYFQLKSDLSNTIPLWHFSN